MLLYTGGFRQGLYDGNGKLYNSQGILLYDGEFLLGVYNGFGTLYQRDGQDPVKGTFVNGEMTAQESPQIPEDTEEMTEGQAEEGD